MLRAIIVDDEAPAIELIKILLQKTGQINVIAHYQSPHEALPAILSLKPDVVFLDIEMPEMNGLELAEHLAAETPDIEVVFVTAYNQYAIQAFRVNALHYLMKPASLDEVQETVNRLYKAKQVQRGPKPPAAARICCFGGLRVYATANTKNAIQWRTAKAEELFAYLFEQRQRSVPKWELCDVLWPGLGENKVATHLHTTIYQVRRALQNAGLATEIKFANGSYSLLLPPTVTSDVAEFEVIIAQGQQVKAHSLEQYERLLTLYQSDYLDGQGYLWALPLQENYRNQFVTYALRLAEFYGQTGKDGQAIMTLRKILEVSPLEEKAHGMLLKLYYLRRDRVAFVQHYTAMKALLKQELGIQPNDNLMAWYEEVMAM